MIITRGFRSEYPRPQFFRDSYQILNGEWDFIFDYENCGVRKKYYQGFIPTHKIIVPFAYNCEASLINVEKRCDSIWYQRRIQIKKEKNKEVLLHLEGSDYVTTVYVNGKKVGSQIGCTYRQTYNVNEYIIDGDNLVVIHCEDSFNTEQVRGKQRWKNHNFECYYKETTGIYKTVWLENVSKTRIESIKLDPSYKDKLLEVCVNLEGILENIKIEVSVFLKNEQFFKKEYFVNSDILKFSLSLEDNFKEWNVLNPALYDIEFKLYKDDIMVDNVLSYFGVRSIEIRDSKIFLNDKELYQKLVLDQGYWKKSEYTAPDSESLLLDINKMIEMGFNGARKHQKVEDERYLYYADALGFLVWAEMPSMYENTEESRKQFIFEWNKVVNQQYNHPSIIVWTPLNESWGVKDIKTNLIQQEFANEIYYLTKKIDSMRLVITNDGWEHTISDILTIHHYEQNGDKLNGYYNTIEKIVNGIWPCHHKGAFADGYKYNNQPIIVSEFGGCAFNKDAKGENWGYGENVNNSTEFISRLESLIYAIKKIPFILGYCYTQLTDVQQEVNGLLDENHDFKIDCSKIKKIINQ